MFSRLRRRHDVGRRERLVELFNRMDCNGDRILHMNEVNEYLQRHRYDPSAIRVNSFLCLHLWLSAFLLLELRIKT